MPDSDWQELLQEQGWQEPDLGARYDSVVHMMTAAAGAEEFYTQAPSSIQPQTLSGRVPRPQANNEARRESAEEARAQDRLIMAAWKGHQGHFVVDNEVGPLYHRRMLVGADPSPAGKVSGFEAKLSDVERFVCHRLGLPAPATTKRELRVDVDEQASTLATLASSPLSFGSPSRSPPAAAPAYCLVVGYGGVAAACGGEAHDGGLLYRIRRQDHLHRILRYRRRLCQARGPPCLYDWPSMHMCGLG